MNPHINMAIADNMNKTEKLHCAVRSALRNYDGLKGEKVEYVNYVNIINHTPEDEGDDSIEEWKTISGIAKLRTIVSKGDNAMSSISNFSFTADIKYTDEKEFKCTVNKLNKSYKL